MLFLRPLYDSWRATTAGLVEMSILLRTRSVVLELGWIEEVVGSRPGLRSLVDGRGNLVLVQVCDVASGENSRHVRLLIVVDDDVPDLISRDAEVFTKEGFGRRSLDAEHPL